MNVAVHNATSFSAIGYETHLCIGAGDDSSSREDLREFYGLNPPENFHVYRIPRWRFRSSTYSFSVFRYAFKLVKSLSRGERVVVFTRESGFLAYLARLCRNPRISGYYELHDGYADLSWVEKKKAMHYREKLYEHVFLPRISGVLCITESQQDMYRKLFPSLPSVAFPLGTKPVQKRREPSQKQKLRTLMYVGHMHKDKGVDFLLETAVKLSEHNIRTIFWGGNPKQVPKLDDKARSLGISDMVEFVPFRPPEEMHNALATRASLGVVMLKDTFYNNYLTCPVKSLDYLSHGIPSLGSDLPSVREVLAYAGTYVSNDDADAFVQAARYLLDDPEHYEKMASLAVQRAHEISWESRAKAIVNFVNSTTKNTKDTKNGI